MRVMMTKISVIMAKIRINYKDDNVKDKDE